VACGPPAAQAAAPRSGSRRRSDPELMRRDPLVPSVLVAVCLGLTACASGPDYQRPDIATPAEFRQQPPPGWKESQAGDRLPRGSWWTLFGDSTLDALAVQALKANNTVQAGDAALRQTRAQLGQFRAARYPVVSGGLSASRSAGSVSGTAADGIGGSVARESYRAGIDASWEIDLWGRIRRSIEAGEAQVQSATADLENLRLSVIAQLASSYFDLRILDAQRQLLTDTVAAYERSLQLTRNRYQAGVVPRVDVVQAEVQWKSTQVQLIDIGRQRALLESAIAVLVGRMPSNFQLDPVTATVAAVADYPGIPQVPVLPVVLPSELLERRPDVAAAERAVAASSARIGVAQAAYYPVFNLTASAGLRESSLPNLLSAPAWFWSPALSLLQSLFDGGARRAIMEQARAAHEAQIASYRQVVLMGFKEVEDSLAGLRILDDEIRLQADTLISARLALQLVNNQYQAGVVNFLNVLTAQTALLNSERALLDLRGRRLAAGVALIKALGGGWEGGG